MRKLIERCPSCGDELVVTRMDCPQCQTRLEGRFRTSAFDRLPPESLAFVELFVRSKGNMKEMERDLGVPYNTVRHRLDEVVRELGPPRPPLEPEPRRPAAEVERQREILDRLDRGEISPDEAVGLLGGE
ncbi:MAG: DUF2089 domain-containing protein, partial [Gemmatimonadota bacterium]